MIHVEILNHHKNSSRIFKSILSFIINLLLILTASRFTTLLNKHMFRLKIQKWLMGTAFFGLATQILLTAKNKKWLKTEYIFEP